MEQFEKGELSDRELDAMLPAWKSPTAPLRLRAAVFPEASSPSALWRRLWLISFRVPLPVACGLAMLLAFGAWRWLQPAAVRVEIRTERVEVPLVKKEVVTVYRDRIVHVPAAHTNASELRPVVELRPRIIRRENVQN